MLIRTTIDLLEDLKVKSIINHPLNGIHEILFDDAELAYIIMLIEQDLKSGGGRRG